MIQQTNNLVLVSKNPHAKYAQEVYQTWRIISSTTQHTYVCTLQNIKKCKVYVYTHTTVGIYHICMHIHARGNTPKSY